MAVIGNIAVSLTAKSGIFSSELNKARGVTRGFASEMANVGRRVLAIGSMITGAGGIAGLVMLVKNQLQAVDSTSKLSRALGISTEELVGLHYAGNLAGVSAEYIDKALKRLTRGLGGVMEGGGEAKKGLVELGLGAEQLASMSPGEAIRIIADRINQLPTAAERGAAAFHLFGREGMNLLPMLSKGSAGLDAAQQAAKRLGLTFSDEAGVKVEAFNDAVKTLKASIGGLGKEIAIAAADKLKGLVTRLTATVLWLGHINSATWASAAAWIGWGAAIGTILFLLPRIIKAIMTIVSAFKALAQAQTLTQALSGPHGWLILAAGAAIAGAAVYGVSKAFDGVSASIDEYMKDAEGVGRTAGDLDNLKDSLLSLQAGPKARKSWMQSMAEQAPERGIDKYLRDATGNADQVAKRFREVDAELKIQTGQVTETEMVAQRLREDFNALADSADRTNEETMTALRLYEQQSGYLRMITEMEAQITREKEHQNWIAAQAEKRAALRSEAKAIHEEIAGPWGKLTEKLRGLHELAGKYLSMPDVRAAADMAIKAFLDAKLGMTRTRGGEAGWLRGGIETVLQRTATAVSPETLRDQERNQLLAQIRDGVNALLPEVKGML